MPLNKPQIHRLFIGLMTEFELRVKYKHILAAYKTKKAASFISETAFKMLIKKLYQFFILQ